MAEPGKVRRLTGEEGRKLQWLPLTSCGAGAWLSVMVSGSSTCTVWEAEAPTRSSCEAVAASMTQVPAVVPKVIRPRHHRP